MKTVSYLNKFLPPILALGLILGPIARADTSSDTTAAKPDAPSAPAVVAAPAVPETPALPEAPAVAAEPVAPIAPVPPIAPAPKEEDEPETVVAQVDEQSPAPEVANSSGSGQATPRHRSRHSGGNDRVSVGSNSTLAEGEEAGSVVSILGSSTTAGKVGDTVVSILGGSRVTGGTVSGEVVSILGNTYINGEVHGEVVTILGNVELGPEAVVGGEVICIGGQVKRAESAVTKGQVQNIGIAGRQFDFTGLSAWFSECLLYGRPLAFDGRLGWAWCVALSFLAFYTLIALIASRGVVKCVETLEQHPGSSLLAALLTLLLTPVAFILLALTLFIAIGFVLIPALSLGLFFAALFGKIVMLAWLGRRFTKLLGDSPLGHPVFGVLIGGLIVLGLYTIPVVGFVTYKLLGILGLGVVVYTIILQIKSNRPVKPVAAAVAGVVPVAAMAATAETGAEMPPMVSPVVSAAPPVISAATLPRAGFWHRLGAALLDFVLLGIVLGMSSKVFHGWFTPGGSLPFWFAVYCVAMWATKGTTIGGIICGLKVVRLDDRPIDWSVAVVRALGGFLSLAVAGLGFIWVAFDDEKQSWHDKIAGTTIVKVPKGTPLL